MKAQTCPAVSDLAAFRAGSVQLDKHFAVAKHLKSCPFCLRKVQTFATPAPIESEDSVNISNEDTTPHVESLRTQLGPYTIRRVIGRGGMGIVYEAEHIRLRNRVAVKVLPRSTLSDPVALGRFRREWEAVGRLAHPNVVRALHADEADGMPFLAMEFIDGPDLANIVQKQGPLSTADATEIVRQAALGLAHVHEQGVIHRDVKPNNLLLTSTGVVKLLDLGLARLTGGDSMHSGPQYLGTADYMAPEQWDGRGADARTDVYSLGCVLIFMLTGRPPFSSTRYPSTRAKMIAHTEILPPGVAAPAGLNELLQKMLAKAPEDRIQTAAEVATRLAIFTVGSQVALLIPAASTGNEEATQPFDEQLTRPVQAPSKPAVQPAAPRAGLWQRIRRFWK